MRALIIEQDMWIGLMIEAVLRDLGYTHFDFAASSEAAIASASGNCPDLITSDIRLDDGTGIEAVQSICSEQVIPVVFVTSTPWEVREADAGAVVVAKPFDEKSLAEGVARATMASTA